MENMSPSTVSKKSVYQKLANIQQEIDVKKNQWNPFGNFPYRSAEDILGALKPLLKKENCTFKLYDDIACIEGRYYVKATATLIDIESGESVSATAFAQESVHPKMSGDQCTGCASTYARKYAMNGLLLLDDIKDADTSEMKNIENAAMARANNAPPQNRNNQPQPPPPPQYNHRGPQNGNFPQQNYNNQPPQGNYNNQPQGNYQR